eukprot:scaffold9263_cov84-Skeletonema_dohrnii-CCMP3373.AAC.1
MNRSNVPSPIRTSATPTAAAANGGGYYPPSNDFNTRDAHHQQPQDSNMNNVASHEHQHYYNDNPINNGHDGSNNNNDNNMMPTSAMRHGRFDSGSSGAIHQQQQEITSPSQVTFQPGAAPPQPTTTITDNNFNSPHSLGANFMFDDIEDFQHYQQQHHTFPPLQTTNDSFPHSPQQSNTTNTGALPTEAQLTLLCLDYLRSLRRSYQNPQDLFHGEGLHADYISLAVWSLSRAFVSPEKLAFGEPKVSKIMEEDDDVGGRKKNKKKKGKEIQLVGGGGLAGVEDECVGNDSFYRLVVKNQQQEGDSTAAIMNNNGIGNSTNDMFELTDSIKLPSMKDITNEVLLSYNTNDNNEEECPIYEQNDMHLSNSHRFYLFNGMASGDDSMGMMGGGGGGANNTPNNNNAPATSSPKAAAGPSIIDGGPLTLTDLTTVALSTLNAKSRIEAEREVVQDPLFESFIHAAGEKGFFNEKKLSGKDALSPEEEERRQRLLYENKYRKVVAKFRSKLAVREEQLMLHNGVGGGMNVGGGGGGWSPRSGQRAMRNVHSVSDQLEMRRDRIIDQVREYRIEEGYRVEEEDSLIVPYSSSEEEQQSVGNFVANYGLEQQTAGDVVASYEQVVPKRTESEERIETNAMVVERAPVNPPSSVAASPSPVASPPSPAKKTAM